MWMLRWKRLARDWAAVRLSQIQLEMRSVGRKLRGYIIYVHTDPGPWSHGSSIPGYPQWVWLRQIQSEWDQQTETARMWTQTPKRVDTSNRNEIESGDADVQTDTGGNLVPASQVPRLTWIPKLGLRTFFEVIRGNRRNLLIISSSGSVFWGLKPETKTPIGMGAKMCKQTQVPGDWHGLGQEYPKEITREYLRQVSCLWPKKLFSVNWYFCRKNLC